MLFLYRILINFIILISPLIIFLRLIKKKENFFRFKEKFCFFSKKRVKGKLIWFHGASVGELQSIFPLLKKSPIILLDEATSSLDAETENKIQKAITFLTKGRTTIVIAHRLSTILNSDKIYVINKGEVVGEGKHDDLLNSSEIYKNFYEKQIKRS